MAVGLHAVNTVNPWLNVFRNTTFTGIAATYLQLHIGDPGAAGTANVATGMTVRQQVTFNVPSGGAMTLANSPTFTVTASETITHISVWSLASGGNFHWSAPLASPKVVVSSDIVTFNQLGIAIVPLAAA